ncbi:MAG: imidazole glycerol phosphate synthase subunit HisH [Planctomycetota bacterium]|jgi:glutamine amidotransferase
MIRIVDYGMGNLRSVQKALEFVGAQAEVVSTPEAVDSADRLILPGVGAFGDAMIHLEERRLVEPLKSYAASGRLLMGICLGMQLVFDSSEEEGEHVGLGLVPGRIVRFRPTDHTLKVPHMGWNALGFEPGKSRLLEGLTPGDAVYFVHSYYAEPADDAVVAARADYDGPFCAAIETGNILATQFHPEKSQKVGLRMLRNFAELPG